MGRRNRYNRIPQKERSIEEIERSLRCSAITDRLDFLRNDRYSFNIDMRKLSDKDFRMVNNMNDEMIALQLEHHDLTGGFY